MKCVKPEMLYHFVQSSFNQFGAQQIFIQQSYDACPSITNHLKDEEQKQTTISADKKGRSNTSATGCEKVSGTTADTNNEKKIKEEAEIEEVDAEVSKVVVDGEVSTDDRML